EGRAGGGQVEPARDVAVLLQGGGEVAVAFLDVGEVDGADDALPRELRLVHGAGRHDQVEGRQRLPADAALLQRSHRDVGVGAVRHQPHRLFGVHDGLAGEGRHVVGDHRPLPGVGAGAGGGGAEVDDQAVDLGEDVVAAPFVVPAVLDGAVELRLVA